MEKNSSIVDKEPILTDISLKELLENSQKSLKEEDIKSALFYLNLAKLSTKTNYGDMASKLIVTSLFAAVYSKTKNERELLNISKKLFKLTKGNKLQSLVPEVLMIIVKIFQKVSQVLEEKGDFGKNLYACWFLYTAKSIYDNQGLKGEDNLYETITTAFPRVMEKIKQNVKKN
jgi:hypothetical protein